MNPVFMNKFFSLIKDSIRKPIVKITPDKIKIETVDIRGLPVVFLCKKINNKTVAINKTIIPANNK